MIFSLLKLKSGEVFGHARAQTFSRMMHGFRCSALDTISSIKKYISFKELCLKNIGRYLFTHLF